MNELVKKAVELQKRIDQEIATNEYNTVKISGLEFSIGDLESLKLYLEEFIKANGLSFGNFMEPMGNEKKLLDKKGIIVKSLF